MKFPIRSFFVRGHLTLSSLDSPIIVKNYQSGSRSRTKLRPSFRPLLRVEPSSQTEPGIFMLGDSRPGTCWGYTHTKTYTCTRTHARTAPHRTAKQSKAIKDKPTHPHVHTSVRTYTKVPVHPTSPHTSTTPTRDLINTSNLSAEVSNLYSSSFAIHFILHASAIPFVIPYSLPLLQFALFIRYEIGLSI